MCLGACGRSARRLQATQRRLRAWWYGCTFRPRHEPALLSAQLRDVAQAVDSRGTFRRATAAAALAAANAALDGSARAGPAGTGGAGERESRAGTGAAAELATCAGRAGVDGNGFAAPVPSRAASSISAAAEQASPEDAHAMLAVGSAARPSVASAGGACAGASVVGGVAAAPELAAGVGAEPAGGATHALEASGRAQQPPDVILSGGEARALAGDGPGSEDEGELLPERADTRLLPGSGPGGQAPGVEGGQPPPGAATPTAEPPTGDAATSPASRVGGTAAGPVQPPGRLPLPASEEEAAVRIAAALKATDARLGRLHAALPPNALLLVLGCQGDTLEVRRLQVSPAELCSYLAAVSALHASGAGLHG